MELLSLDSRLGSIFINTRVELRLFSGSHLRVGHSTKPLPVDLLLRRLQVIHNDILRLRLILFGRDTDVNLVVLDRHLNNTRRHLTLDGATSHATVSLTGFTRAQLLVETLQIARILTVAVRSIRQVHCGPQIFLYIGLHQNN